MIRPILTATLLVATGAATPPAAQAQLVDCRSTGKLEITQVGRNQMPGGEGGGLAINVMIVNRQATTQRFVISYNGWARNKVINQERAFAPYQRKSEWVATLSGGTAISDPQILSNLSLLCY